MFHTEERSICGYLNQDFPCTCGRVHHVPIRQVIIAEDALCSLTDILSKAGSRKVFFLYDTTTYSVAGTKIAEIMQNSNIPSSDYILAEAEPVPDEKTIGSVLIHFDPDCDMIVSVGSGTINDIGRFISFKLHLPYMVIATAPSMDGFASNVSPLIVNHMKTTYEAKAPVAILGDVNLLKEAPMEMIAAGIGDILGKYTCLCDWEIAHILLEEYHCSTIEQMVRYSIHTVTENMNLVKSRDPKAVKSIMEALVLSGIAMSFAGNSRPASGSEHHLSHYFEMMFLFQGKKPILHGAKVGIATIAVLKAYEILMEKEINFTKAKEEACQFSMDNWQAKMKETYGAASASVISLEKSVGKNVPEKVISRLDRMEVCWKEMERTIKRMPSADSIRTILLDLNAPASPTSVGIDRKTFVDGFLAAKELRNRYGLLQILFDLGLGEEIALQVWDYLES